MGLKNFGATIQLTDFKGSLLAIRYLGEDITVQTKFGEQVAARAEVIEFLTDDDDNVRANRLGTTLVFQRAIANEIRGSNDWSVGVFESAPIEKTGVPDATMYTLTEPEQEIQVLAAAMKAAGVDV